MQTLTVNIKIGNDTLLAKQVIAIAIQDVLSKPSILSYRDDYHALLLIFLCENCWGAKIPVKFWCANFCFLGVG